MPGLSFEENEAVCEQLMDILAERGLDAALTAKRQKIQEARDAGN